MDTSQLEELKKQIESILIVLNRLIEEEQFPAYVRLSKSYEKELNGFSEGKSINYLKEQIKWNCRILGEAPPRNKELGINLMNKMDKVYKSLFINTNKE